LRATVTGPFMTWSIQASKLVRIFYASCWASLTMLSVTSEDVAEDVIYVASRPPHVQVAELTAVPTYQAGLVTHRT
jgi:hypothetical protein